MSKTEVSGKQVKDGSIELVDLSTGLANTISGKADSSSLATIATSGSYADLSDKPTFSSFTNLTSPSNGQFLKFNGTDWVNSALPVADGDTAGVVNGDFQIFNGTKRLNAAAQSAGIGSLSTEGAGQTLNLFGVLGGVTTGANIAIYGGDTNGSITFQSKDSQYGELVTRASFDTAGYFSTLFGASISSGAAATKGLIVKGAASQTANLLEAQNSSGTTLASIDAAGTVHSTKYTETSANTFTTTLAPSSGTLTVDTSAGTCILGGLNASVTTWAFTNVSTDNNKATTVTVFVNANPSYTYGDACSVNGVSVSGGIRWPGGTTPTPSLSNVTDVITFIIVRDSAGTIRVYGSGATNFQ